MQHGIFHRTSILRRIARAVRNLAVVSSLVVFTGASALGLQSVTIGWHPSNGLYIAGYVIHCGVESGSHPVFITTGPVTNATVWGLVEGATYYFTVSAYNYFGVESEESNEIIYTVPSDGTSPPSPTSLLAAVSGTPPIKSILKVNITGSGTVSPNLNGQELVNGKTYTVTAVPAAGQVFAGWSGNVVSPAVKLVFVMNPTLALNANFMPNPFVPAAGNYTGLFYEQDGVNLNSAGLFTVSVTSRGTYSARFQIGKDRLSLSGQLDTQLHSVSAIKRKNAAPLAAEVNIGSGENFGTVSGSLTDTNWTAQLLGDRARFHSKTNPAPFAGNYTLAIPGVNGTEALPTGDGFGSMRVDAGGIVKLSGALADGTKLTQSAPISTAGHWPFFVSLYSGKGLIMGWVNFTNKPEADMEATVDWIKTTGVKGDFYLAGFTNECPLVGSFYTRPIGPTNLVLNLTNATVSFTGGNLTADFTNFVTLGLNSRVTNLSSNRLTLNFSLSAGTFTGSATDPSSGKSRSFLGAVLQKQNIGAGFMLVTNQSSRVSIAQ